MPVTYKEAQADKVIGYAGNIVNKTILDVGPGKGILLKKIPHGRKTAVDISVDYLKPFKEEMPVFISNAENLPFADEFDLIFLTDILEHVSGSSKVLKSLRRALKIGGTAIIRVPHKEDLSKYNPAAVCKYEFVHLRAFDKNSLKQLIETPDCG